MRGFRSWTILIAGALVLSSCGGSDGAAGPSSGPAPVAGAGSPWDSTATPPADTTGAPGTPGTPTEDDSLESILHAEQARIAQRRIDSEAVHDSLGLVWDLISALPVGQLPSPLLLCQPDDYAGSAAIIGPDGGDIQFGRHRLRIPQGALAARTVVTAEAPTSLMIAADFSPHGLQFQKDVELYLDYERCTQPLFFPAFRVVYLDDLLQILEVPPSEDYRNSRWIRGWIRHFSKYAVAY